MNSLRISGVITVIVLMGAALGGCPLADEMLQSTALPTDPSAAGTPVDNSNEEGAADTPIKLKDLAAEIAEGDAAYELAWSYGQTTISVNPNIDVGDTYERGYRPSSYTGGSSDDDWWWGLPDFGDWGDPGGSGDSGDSDDGDDSDDNGCIDADDPGAPPGDSDTRTYVGTLDCLRTEALRGCGESSEETCYNVSLVLNEPGVLGSIPVPVTLTHRMMSADVRFVGDSDTQIIPFSHDEVFTVTVTVVSASYTTHTANVVLDVEAVWIGEYSGIVVRGVHTLETQIVDGNLTYSSDTQYELDLWAADDWSGDATDDYDCDGVLALQ